MLPKQVEPNICDQYSVLLLNMTFIPVHLTTYRRTSGKLQQNALQNGQTR